MDTMRCKLQRGMHALSDAAWHAPSINGSLAAGLKCHRQGAAIVDSFLLCCTHLDAPLTLGPSYLPCYGISLSFGKQAGMFLKTQCDNFTLPMQNCAQHQMKGKHPCERFTSGGSVYTLKAWLIMGHKGTSRGKEGKVDNDICK